MAAPEEGAVNDLLLDVVKRAPALAALRDGPLSKRELESAIGVSQPTAHRIVTALAERDLVERVDGAYELTGRGVALAGTVTQFRSNVRSVDRLAPLLDVIDLSGFDLDLSLFDDATLVVSEPGDPYAVLHRLMTLIHATGSFRIVQPYAATPLANEEIGELALGGMEMELVYNRDVATYNLECYGEHLPRLLDCDHVSVRIHEGIPCGVALFDDHVGIGGVDPETGILSVSADTDDPGAVAWGEAIYRRYRDEAVPLDEHPELVP